MAAARVPPPGCTSRFCYGVVLPQYRDRASGGHYRQQCRLLGCEHGPRVRLFGLDRLRGLAVVLMVADHVLVALQLGGPAVFLARVSVTRAALPLFCLVAGSLAGARPRWQRLGLVAAAGAAATALSGPVGIGRPDVLLLLAGALLLVGLVRQGGPLWWLVLVAAMLQPTTWPSDVWPVPWSGYEPGLVVALVMVGQLVGRHALNRAGELLPPVLALCGSWPLTVYVVHLAALRGVLCLI